jgi:predicted ArsR family transcriptional regulator
MSVDAPKSDSDVLDLLRSRGPLGASELAAALEVTHQSVRCRLKRLMAKEMIQRDRTGHSVPRHHYRLAEKMVQVPSVGAGKAEEARREAE